MSFFYFFISPKILILFFFFDYRHFWENKIRHLFEFFCIWFFVFVLLFYINKCSLLFLYKKKKIINLEKKLFFCWSYTRKVAQTDLYKKKRSKANKHKPKKKTCANLCVALIVFLFYIMSNFEFLKFISIFVAVLFVIVVICCLFSHFFFVCFRMIKLI